MEQDKNIEEIFAAFRPDMGDAGAFMAGVGKKLDAVEYVKRMQERQIRRYRRAVVAAFVAGLVAGIVAIWGVWSVSPDVFMLSFAAGRLSVHVAGEYVQWFVLILLSAGVISAAYGMANNMQTTHKTDWSMWVSNRLRPYTPNNKLFSGNN